MKTHGSLFALTEWKVRELELRPYCESDLPQMRCIWNEVVAAENAFPQEEPLSLKEAEAFFVEQSFTGVAEENGKILGLFILHPNNIGRCGHIANASYAVASDSRGEGAGEALVRYSLKKGRELGFRLLQFNAVVASNHAAIRLYEKLGFVKLGTVEGGFRHSNGSYEDIILFYHAL